MTTDGELWHFVEAKRDDGMPTMFNIRELEPKKQLTKIFVVELPYPKTTPACLPSAADYRRHTDFDEQWLRPACSSLGWELVGSKIEDGSFYFYMYGAGDPNGMIEKLSPFDASLGFYDDDDPDWQEYGTLRDLLDQAKAIPVTGSGKTNGTPTKQPTQPTQALRPAAKKAAKGAKAAKTAKAAKAAKAPKANGARKRTKQAAKTPTKKVAKKPTAKRTATAKAAAAKRKRR